MRFAILLLFAFTACDRSGIVEGELPPGNSEIRTAATSICGRPLYCGAIGYLDCDSAVDGPAYYFRRDGGEIVSSCGGYCMAGPEGRCARECPPPEWTCERPMPDLAKHRARR